MSLEGQNCLLLRTTAFSFSPVPLGHIVISCFISFPFSFPPPRHSQRSWGISIKSWHWERILWVAVTFLLASTVDVTQSQFSQQACLRALALLGPASSPVVVSDLTLADDCWASETQQHFPIPFPALAAHPAASTVGIFLFPLKSSIWVLSVLTQVSHHFGVSLKYCRYRKLKVASVSGGSASYPLSIVHLLCPFHATVATHVGSHSWGPEAGCPLESHHALWASTWPYPEVNP